MEKDASAAVDQFTRRAAAEGWLFAVDGHFCPQCYREMVARDRKRMAQLQRAQEELEALKDREKGYQGGAAASLVQIGGSPAQIKAARELEERRRRLTTGLKQGLGGVQ